MFGCYEDFQVFEDSVPMSVHLAAVWGCMPQSCRLCMLSCWSINQGLFNTTLSSHKRTRLLQACIRCNHGDHGSWSKPDAVTDKMHTGCFSVLLIRIINHTRNVVCQTVPSALPHDML